MPHTFNSSIFREYDIRGTADKDFSTADFYQIGLRLATLWKNNGTACVGRDGRISSPQLTQSLIDGLRDGGISILDIGVGPTPMLYFATKETPATVGLMVTGSHNPGGDNGIKITLKDEPFYGPQIQEIMHVVPKMAQTRGDIEHIDVRHSYINRLIRDFSPSKKALKIAWDPGNGAAGEIVELLTSHIPGDHFLINSTIDGTFPVHHPDPSVAKNMEQLRDVILSQQCDLGIAFDGDGDRLGVIDSQGRILAGDELLTILACDLVRQHPGAKILADVKCSTALFQEIRACGGHPIMCRTGHSNIKKELPRLQALLAGEMSGHIFYADQYYGFDDALYAAIRLLQLLHNSESTLAELLNGISSYINTPEVKTICADDKKFAVIEVIKEQLINDGISFIDIDGVRVETPQGWWLIRASNTGPHLISRCEGKNHDGLQSVQQQLTHYLDIGLSKT